MVCYDCGITCHGCEDLFCHRCFENGSGIMVCECCGRYLCHEKCAVDAVIICNICGGSVCENCLERHGIASICGGCEMPLCIHCREPSDEMQCEAGADTLGERPRYL